MTSPQGNTFYLPDLGEGLQEAEIVGWHVKTGDTVAVDQPLVAVETAKAVVEVPSPRSGVVSRLHAKEGDIVPTGAPLVDFDGTQADTAEPVLQQDAATVVGNVPTGGERIENTAIEGSRRRRTARIKATPSVRTEARRLGIDLAEVVATGRNGQITMADLTSFTGSGQTTVSANGSDEDLMPGSAERLRGPRRSMAQSMTRTRDEVALCTIFDDADIDAWPEKRDFTARLLRSMSSGCAAEPRLNGFFDAEQAMLQIESRVDVALAVDTDDGLIVPVIRNVERMSLGDIRERVAQIKQATLSRTVNPQDMLNYTITLSNFGTLSGRYATPMMVPPTVAILGTGRLQHDVVAVVGAIEVHPRIPLSLSFDHRCITGGDACRFLAAVIKDLEKPE